MKKFLLAGFYFDGYHGSMMHICEIAKYLKSIGFDVTIAAVSITDEIKNYVKDIGINLVQVLDIPQKSFFDYGLCYHFPILSFLLHQGVVIDKLIIGSLSSILELEMPNLIYKYGIPIHVHNASLKEKFKKELLIYPSNIYVMPNLVPIEYLNFKKQTSNDQIKNIAIVSNHIPKEIREATSLLALQKINIDIYGKADNYIAITPQILSQYDVIISIGKTVQYALALGIPVYNYDHFGGMGYINTENIKREEYYNFSGRSSFRKIEADDIVCELLAYYKQTLAEKDKLKEYAARTYAINTNMEGLISYLDKLPPSNIEEFLQNEKLYIKCCNFIIYQCSNLFNENKHLKYVINNLKLHLLIKYRIKLFFYKHILKNTFKREKYEKLLGIWR